MSTTGIFSSKHGSGLRAFLLSFLICLLPVLYVSAVHAASSEDYLKEAQDYVKKGDINAAIIQLKNALQKDPKNIKARFFLGEQYLALGDGASAEKELSRAQSLGMARQQMVVPLGRALLIQGHADEVLKQITIEKDFPVDVQVEVHVLRANAHIMLEQNKEAESAFLKAIELEPKSLNALAGQTRLAMIKGDTKEAKALADRLTSLHPESDVAWLLDGELKRMSGDMPSAEKSFDRALSLQAYNVSALLGSASVKLALGDMEGAAKRIEVVQRLSPNHPMGNYLKATLLYSKSDIAGAEASLQKALKFAPTHLPSQQLLGAIDFSKGRFEQADQALSRVVQAYPGNVAAVKLLAATRLKLNQPAEAIKVLEPVLPTAQDDAQLLALAGTAYMQNKQTEKGTEYLEKAVAAAPDTAGIRTQLALGRVATGNTTQAVEDLEAAIDLGQNVFQADVMLIMLHLQEKRYDKALAQAQEFAKKAPTSPLPFNLMGAAYIGLEQLPQARQQFQQAIDKEASFIPAIINLARLDERENNPAAARSRYESILKQRDNHLGALLSLAKLADAEGNGEEAVRLLEKAWESNEDAIQPGMVLIDYYNKKQQPLRAVSIARDLSLKHPNNPVVINALGMSQMAAKDYHNAQASFESLVKLLPESPQAHLLLAQINRQMDDREAARKHLNQSLALQADFLPAQLSLAQMELQQKRPKAALAIAKKIQQQRPTEADGFRLQGDVLMAEGDHVAAVKLYQQAYDKSPASALAILIFQARKMAKVKAPYASLEIWLAKNPQDQLVGSLLAGAYQEHGKLDKAVEQYQQVVKNHPNDVAALNNLAWSSHMLGKADALDYAKRAYDLAGDNPAVADTFGWLLVETGNTDRGLALLQQAVAKAPQIAEIRYHLSVGLHKAGRKSEAKSELKRTLDMAPDFSEAKAARALLAELEK